MDRSVRARCAVLVTVCVLVAAVAQVMLVSTARASTAEQAAARSRRVHSTVVTAPSRSAVRAPYVAAAKREAARPRVTLTARWAHSTTPVPLCAAPAPGHPECLAIGRKASAPAVRPHAPGYNAPGATFQGYQPADLQAAYGTAGSSATPLVAIVDAYDDPSAETDLGTYRSTFGLPACTTANGCFTKVDQNGGTTYPPTDGQGANGWMGETALDLDAVSAVCPTCHILLVEANDDTTLDAAAHEATVLGATYVSMSWGTDEADLSAADIPALQALDALDYSAPGVTYVAASGDESYTYQGKPGGGLNWPASSPHVVAAGGVSLHRDPSTGAFSDAAWSGGGSGCSQAEPAQPWQQSTAAVHAVCPEGRAAVDVSADADPDTGLLSYVAGTWDVAGGTSLATPLLTALYALTRETAGSSTGAVQANEYAHAARLLDVTTGSTGACGDALCVARTGWDGPTGLGTPTSPSELYTPAAGSATVTAAWPRFTYGTTATVRATVTGPLPSTGTVSLRDGSTTLATAVLPGTSTSQTVALSVASDALAPGTHTLTLSFTGDTNVGGDSISDTVTVAKATPAVTAVWPAAATYGEAFTVKATVRATVSPASSGTVSLLSGSRALARASMPAGAGTSKTVSLPVRGAVLTAGARALRVVYSGDRDVAGVSLPAHSLTVRKATPTIAAAWPATARVGSRLAVKATIRAPGALSSSGTVAIKLGSTVLARVHLPAGGASTKRVTVTVGAGTVPRGRHTLTLAYSGDANVSARSTSHAVQMT